MKEEILQKLENGCNLNDLFDTELDWLLSTISSSPEAMKGERSYE